MKYIAIYIITLFCVQKLQAQEIEPTAGSYYINNTMTAFHGTWRWISGTDTLKIYLVTKKTYCDMNGGFYWDLLTGWHIYKKGNTVVEKSYDDIDDLFFTSTISLSNGGEQSSSIEGTLKDLAKNKYGDLTLTLNAAGNQLTWQLKNTEGLHYRKQNDPPFDYGFTLPKDMVLTKQ